jgi:hypothetical protein
LWVRGLRLVDQDERGFWNSKMLLMNDLLAQVIAAHGGLDRWNTF